MRWIELSDLDGKKWRRSRVDSISRPEDAVVSSKLVNVLRAIDVRDGLNLISSDYFFEPPGAMTSILVAYPSGSKRE